MQYLKEEIKTRIIDVAKKEFFLKGFKDANMREIAIKSGITVGNIYRYFPSKTVLFEEILKPVMDNVKRVVTLQQYISVDGIHDENTVIKFVHTVVKICADYKMEIVIINSRSEGTKYEGTKDYLISTVADIIDRSFEKSNKDLARIMAVAVLSGIHETLVNYDDNDKIVELISKMIYNFFKN